MIDDAFISQLLDRVDIIEIVQHYVPLKKAGSEWHGLCPFHTEKTPSFTVSPSKQFYHCFGCGAHGTAVGFLMHHAGFTFREAVENLAQRVGMTVPDDQHAKTKVPAVEENLYQLMADVTQYYRQQLKHSVIAVNYLKNRALTGQTAAFFGIGYASDGFQNLQTAFPHISVADFLKTGLMVENDKGRQYDRFRHRIMFPIHDAKGRPIGFGARSIDGAGPKYLNSPETSLFYKGKELYGLYQAKQAISKAGYCWITEGYFDVVSLHQAGVCHAVASLGTAVTADQLRKLLRYTSKLYFCFDGDMAGKKAANRVLTTLLEFVTDQRQFFFLFLPEGHDPDSFVRAYGRERFETLQETAMPFSKLLLTHIIADHRLDILEERAAVLDTSKQWLSKIKQAPLLRMAMLAEVSEKTGLAASQIEAVIEPERRKASRNPAQSRTKVPLQSISLFDRLLSIILNRPAWCADIADCEGWQIMDDAEARLFFEVLGRLDEHQEMDKTALLAQLVDVNDQSRLSKAADFQWAASLAEEELKAEWAGGLKQVVYMGCQQKLDHLKSLVNQRPLTETEKEDMNRLLKIIGAGRTN